METQVKRQRTGEAPTNAGQQSQSVPEAAAASTFEPDSSDDEDFRSAAGLIRDTLRNERLDPKQQHGRERGL